MTARTRIHEMALARRDSPRSVREGETALSPQRNSESAPAAAKEGVREGTMGSPTPTGYRGIVEAVSELAGVTA